MKHIEIKNFHSEITKYCIKKSLDICDNEIIKKMIKDGYTFCNIPPSRVKRCLAELRIAHTNGTHKESLDIIMNELKPCPNCEKKEELEDEEYNLNNDSD